MNNRYSVFNELVKICERLRGEEGCLWDKEQTHKSLLPYLREEAREVEMAVINKDMPNLQEELGDLIFQVVFHSQIASERGDFDICDVIEGLNNKLIRRHPHVFSNIKISSVEDILKNWENIKREEKKSG